MKPTIPAPKGHKIVAQGKPEQQAPPWEPTPPTPHPSPAPPGEPRERIGKPYSHQNLARRLELRPLDDILFTDPIAMQIAERYVYGEICTLVECLFQIARHCSKRGRECAEREIQLLSRGLVTLSAPELS
jgi:hypothetical protein